MKQVGLDYFTQFRFPSQLRANGAGLAAFVTRRADPAENRNLSALWLLQGGSPRRMTDEGELRGYWWCGTGALVLARPGGEKDRALEKRGIPCTSLQLLPATGPGEAVEFLRLNMEVEEVLCLGPQRMLILAVWDPAVEAALKAAKNDAEKAAGLLEAEADYQVFTELPFWANGEGVTGGKRRRLYLWDGKKCTPVTDEQTEAECPRLSFTGGQAYYLGKRYSTVAPYDNRLMRLDLRTLQSEDITFAEGTFSHYEIHPLEDGTLLVAGSNLREFGLMQNPAFYRYDPAAGTAEALDMSGRYDLGASVASDLSMAAGARIFSGEGRAWFVTTVDEGAHLMCLDLATGAITQVTAQPGAVTEAVRDDDGFVVIALRGLEGPELYRVEEDGAERRLTDFNAAATAGVQLAAPAPLAYTTPRGVQIRGWVMLPPGLEKGAKCPAILDIHGGPKTVYGPVLFHEMQYWAAQGYAVMFCNPTGGDGRGDNFADLRGHYGEVDYNDIMGFVDAALAAYPCLDAARLGVTGGSYGGFMTNWIISHTTRFAAAASQRGISNWLSMATMSDIGYFFVPDQTGTGVWDNPATVLGQSPLKFANKVKTPTLFIHSEEDYRCPLAEGIQMYTALQVHGVKTRLCIFRGENHELSRSGKPSHRVRRLKEITDWFDAHLKPGAEG